MSIVAFIVGAWVVWVNFIKEEAATCNAEPQRLTVGAAS